MVYYSVIDKMLYQLIKTALNYQRTRDVGCLTWLDIVLGLVENVNKITYSQNTAYIVPNIFYLSCIPIRPLSFCLTRNDQKLREE